MPPSTLCAAHSRRSTSTRACDRRGDRGRGAQPQRGEHLGQPGASFKADIAVDPVEGTSYLVRGLTNALAVLRRCAPRGA
ncbi:fructose-bisphosphatase class II [Methyloceanibacter marginalis]|uniref:fructose-bisphosphatase class II n=1 Tax=Methyloceanibacter marginalis TaxID=1774971 RepID=UPI001300FA8C